MPISVDTGTNMNPLNPSYIPIIPQGAKTLKTLILTAKLAHYQSALVTELQAVSSIKCLVSNFQSYDLISNTVTINALT